MQSMEANAIATRPGTHAIHLLGFYAQKFGIIPQDFPNSLVASETSMAIPLHNRLSRKDQDRVIEVLRNINLK
jgi:dTDP-4-amino-4,6-dideoxygalactose transaminase